MNILIVDDERPALRVLERAVREAVPACNLAAFTSAAAALDYAKEAQVAVAFLDIDMGDMDGLSLAKRLKAIHGTTNIIFVTGHAQYAVDAFSVSASGYLLKPVDAAAVQKALGELRHPVQAQAMSRVRIQCFGSFGVFVDGKPLLFTRAKVRELLAYLVHKRGAAASTAEIATILWEDKENTRSVQSQTRTVIAQLMQCLKAAGIGDIVHKAWNSIAIDVAKVACDYYQMLGGNVEALNAYTGEYMNDYSWAEFMIGQIDMRVQRQSQKQ